MKPWYLYLVRTRCGSLYAGVSTDVPRRLGEHTGTSGRGAKYLRSRGPLRLAYCVRLGSHELALRAESGIKRLSKRRKEWIVASAPKSTALLDLLGIRPPG